MSTKSKIMRRAWKLKRGGHAETFAECLADAWAEAKGGVMIVTDFTTSPPAPSRPTISQMMGWLARIQVCRLSG